MDLKITNLVPTGWWRRLHNGRAKNKSAGAEDARVAVAAERATAMGEQVFLGGVEKLVSW